MAVRADNRAVNQGSDRTENQSYYRRSSRAAEQAGSRRSSRAAEQTGSRRNSRAAEQADSRRSSRAAEQAGSRRNSRAAEQSDSRRSSRAAEQTGGRRSGQTTSRGNAGAVDRAVSQAGTRAASKTANMRISQKENKAGKAIDRRLGLVRRTAGVERDYFDYRLLAIVILLTCFGLVMLYSTSAYKALLETKGKDDMSYFRKQALISCGAMILALIGSQIDYHFFAKHSMTIYWISVALLIITKFAGRSSHGATRWLKVGPFSFQTAELTKLAIILLLPVLIVKMGHKLKGLKAPGIVFGFGFIAAFCTYFFTDNLSTAIIILGIAVVLIFITHPKTVPFLVGGAIGVGLIGLLVILLVNSSGSGSFRIRRIQVWLNPEANANDGGYQVMQGLYAIGSGGFFGKGLGNSAQKLGALPEAQNDMIFSIICEELGVFGAVLVILMFVFLLSRLYFIAKNAPDLLGSLIATGIFVHIALQVVLNIAVVTNTIPTTGITLPFVSYGGTSILFLMAEISLALSISGRIRFNS